MALSHTLSTAFRQSLRGTCTLSRSVQFSVYNSCISTAVKVNAYKMFTCSRGFVLQSDWVRQIQAPEVDSFSRECYQALSSPRFERREPGIEASPVHSPAFTESPAFHTDCEHFLSRRRSAETQCWVCTRLSVHVHVAT